MAVLKACPFCGGEARFVISSHENSDTSKWHKIMCGNWECGASLGTALSGWSPDYNEQVEELKQRWNRRTNNEPNLKRFPLTEIPTPHGRLIDADRLIEYINEELKGDEYIQRMFRRIVKSRPTVIEAEE